MNKCAPAPWSVKDRASNYFTRIVDARGHDVVRISPSPDRTVEQENEIADAVVMTPHLIDALRVMVRTFGPAEDWEDEHGNDRDGEAAAIRMAESVLVAAAGG